MSQFINSIDDDHKRQDSKVLLAMMTKATGVKPVMWGPAIVGFDEYEYEGASGRKGKWFKVGFSPRKAALSLYLMGGKDKELLAKLGPSSTSGGMGAGCLYIKRLDDVHKPTLQKLITQSVKKISSIKKGRD